MFTCFMSKKYKREKKFEFDLANFQSDDIKILPVKQIEPLQDIFSDDVQHWSIYIVGKHRQILLGKDSIGLSSEAVLINKKYDEVLTKSNATFFDIVFDALMDGVEKPFFLLKSEQLYLCNIYAFHNEKNKIIGSILLLRLYKDMENEIKRNNEVPIQGRKHT